MFPRGLLFIGAPCRQLTYVWYWLIVAVLISISLM